MKDWALKYRPQRLVDLVGQDRNKEILTDLVNSANLYNAMIFYGRSGCGKTTTARILVNELQAELIELDAASNNGVDDARVIKDIAGKLALTGKRKIIIIDEAHMLSKAAWNALLKTIEEPNDKTHFIFCTTEYAGIPLTIRGRCRMFKFYGIQSDVMLEHAKQVLQQEKAELNDDCIELIIKEANGQMRDMLISLQTAVNSNLTTKEKFSKYRGIPSTTGMGAYIEGVLDSKKSKQATTSLKNIECDIFEWKTRLERLIYEALEDHYGLGEMNGTLQFTKKMKDMITQHGVKKFGKLLDKLIRITQSEKAFMQLYTLAQIGVE